MTTFGCPAEEFNLTHYELLVLMIIVVHKLPRNVSVIHMGAHGHVLSSESGMFVPSRGLQKEVS